MSYFNECRFCGANLDPGERCDCMKKPDKEILPEKYRQYPAGNSQKEIGPKRRSA